MGVLAVGNRREQSGSNCSGGDLVSTQAKVLLPRHQGFGLGIFICLKRLQDHSTRFLFSRPRAAELFGAEENWIGRIVSRIPLCLVVVFGMTEHHSSANSHAPNIETFRSQRRRIVGIVLFDDFGACFGAFWASASSTLRIGVGWPGVD